VDLFPDAVREDTAKGGPHTYAAYWGGPLYIAEGATRGVFEDLTDYIASDTDIIFTDILPIFRTTLASYDNRIYTVMFDGNIHSLFYRADILEANDWEVPPTIEELIEQASALNGTDLNEDGEPDYGFCINFGEVTSRDGMYANTVLAPFLQTQSSTQGFLFDPDTFEPNIDTDAAKRGLQLFKQLLEEGTYKELFTSGISLDDMKGLFLSGRCAFMVDWGGLPRIAFYTNQTLSSSMTITHTENGTDYPYAKELFHTAPWPGSSFVMDPETRETVECTRSICPFAIQEGATFINISPYNAFGGFGGMISSLVSQQEKDEAFAMISFWNAPTVSNYDVIDPESWFEPFRYTQFLPFLWLDAGMSEAQVKAYTIEMRANLENENIALELRVPGSTDYLYAEGLHVRSYIDGDISVDEAIKNIKNEWDSITDDFGGRKEQRDINRKLLGLEPIEKDKGGGSDDTVIIVVPTIVGSLLLFLCLGILIAALVSFLFKYKFHVILLPRHAEDTV